MALRNSLAQRVGILDQSQLDELLPKETNAPITKPRMENKIKKTPMRIVISLLLQNPHLVSRISPAGVQALRNEAGFELLLQLSSLCREREGISTGQILEHFRDSEYRSPLEILASWEHLLDDAEIITAFSQNYRRLNIQAIERDIAMLIAKERTEGLSEIERGALITLLKSKEEQKKQLVNPL